jgi:hypothetical protein
MEEFAGKSINHWFQFIKRNHSAPDWDVPKLVLDEEALLGQEGLNEVQVGQLREELIARGLLPAPALEGAAMPTLADIPVGKTFSVKPEGKKAKEPPPTD